MVSSAVFPLAEAMASLFVDIMGHLGVDCDPLAKLVATLFTLLDRFSLAKIMIEYVEVLIEIAGPEQFLDKVDGRWMFFSFLEGRVGGSEGEEE